MGDDSLIPGWNWFDEPVKQSVNAVFAGMNSGFESLDLLKKYRKTHFRMLAEAVSKVKVLGMASPLNLEEFYYPAQVSTDIRRRLYQEEWVKLSEPSPALKGNATKSVDGSSFVEKHDRLVILGGPGAGKTTFLKYLALAYSKREIFETTKLESSKLPFFVSLPEFSKSDATVFDYISNPLAVREGEHAKAFIERFIKKRLSVVFFDSLDEVPSARRESAICRLREFSSSHPEAKIVVSCRTADYKEVLESFVEVELVKLSKAAVKKVVKSWFQSDNVSADRLLGVIEGDKGIACLTETPLLLSLLCIQFRHDLLLPRRRVEVYKRCVETLLRDWDTSRGFRRQSAYESLSDDHKERLFEHIAGSSLRENQAYVISKSRLLQLTSEYVRKLGLEESDAEAVIREVESHHGIIEQHAVNWFCFSHSSIHDYFAARHALSNRIELELLKANLEDEFWSGVIEFVCGLHANPGPLFDFMAQKAGLKNLKNFPAIERRAKLLHLMYRCLSVGPILDPEVSEKMASHISNSVEAFTAVLSAANVHQMCTYSGEGVHHPYFFTGSRRPTLHAALLPFRRLSNEILLNPVPSYARVALEHADRLLSGESLGLPQISALLNLVVPLAKSEPDAVFDRLQTMKRRVDFTFISGVIDRTLATIAKS